MKAPRQKLISLTTLYIMIALPIAALCQQTVTWTSLVGVSTNGTGLIRTLTTGSGDAGAISTQTIPASTNGYIEMLNGSSNRGYIGLSATNPNASSTTINYAFRLDRRERLNVYQNGTELWDSEHDQPNISLGASTVLRIERVGSTIYYKVDGVTVWSTNSASTSALFVDTNLSSLNHTLPGVTIFFPDPFNPPSNLLVNTTGTNSSGLTWTDNSTIETGFQIERSLSETTGFALIHTTAANITTFSDLTLAVSTQYFYRVRAVNSSGNTAYTPVKSIMTYTPASWFTNSSAIFITGNTKVGIGTSNPDDKLTVDGSIHAEEIRIEIVAPAPDYVFEPDYELMPLHQIEAYINANKHLPEVPSAKQIEAEGIKMSEISMLLLKKVEELTLHIIEQDKRIKELEKVTKQ